MAAKFEKYSRTGELTPSKYSKQIRELDKLKLYYYRLLGPGSELLLQSDGYSTVESRDKAIAAVKVFAGGEENYERTEILEGKWYFKLRCGQSGTVGTSPLYNTTAEMETGIQEARQLAPDAMILEEPINN